MISIINWLAAILLLATSVGLVTSRDWRWNLGLLAVQYLGAFWLTFAHWPIAMSAVNLVTGWMACTALGMTFVNLPAPASSETAWPQSWLFRIAAATLVWTAALALAFRLSAWLGIELPVAWGSLSLMGMGLFYLGMTLQPARIIYGLLTLLSGFEILYAAVETSVLVAALLVAVTLGLALVGAWLLNTTPSPENR
jgi:hypothetical protein